MKKINLPPAPAIHKYQRPAFGDGRVYLGCVDGHIICLGSPVAQPFTCTSPIDFGSVTTGTTATLTISCKANIAVTSITGLTLTNPLFTASNSSLPTGPLSAGQTFSFPATFNLTTASIQNTNGTSYSGVKPGVASGSIILFTVNGVAGYATSQPLAVSGKTVSNNGFLSLSPAEVDFGGLVVNSAAAQAGKPGSMVISNLGASSLTIIGSSWVNANDNNANSFNVTQIGSTGQYTVGNAFNATNWPQPGFVIQGGASISISLTFRGNNVGTFGSLITIYSTGGRSQNILLAGTMSTSPVAALTVNNGPGGAFQPSVTGTTKDATDGSTITQVGVDFGNVSPGQSSTFSKFPLSHIIRLLLTFTALRMSNSGGSSLLITKSKPPQGVELTAANPTGDLPEGGQVSPNSNADAAVLFAPNPTLSHLNSDPRPVNGTWTLNTDDLTFGVHVVTFTGTVVVPQKGPLNPAGLSIYKYLGCFQDSANGGPRLLSQETDNGANNENGLCQNQAHAGGAVFAGTEYHTQCWYGNSIPSNQFVSPDSTPRCTWTCPADSTQPCGGDGGWINIFYDSTKYNPATGVCTGCSGSAAPPTGGGAAVIEKTVGSYGYIGCYTEAINGRALSSAAFAGNTNTPESCAVSCSGYTYFGVEYSSECYCGNTLNAGSVLTQNGDAECNMPCAGNSTALCGAGNRLSMYRLGGTASGSSSLGISSTSVSSASIISSTSSISSTGSISATPVVPATLSNSTIGSISSTSSVPSISSISSTAVPTTNPPGPASKVKVGAYSYVGCQTELANARALNGAAFASDTMTLEMCMADCAGFSIFGVEYGRELVKRVLYMELTNSSQMLLRKHTSNRLCSSTCNRL